MASYTIREKVEGEVLNPYKALKRPLPSSVPVTSLTN